MLEEKPDEAPDVNCEDVQESEYTDEQFYADLKKARKQLDAMEEEALREYKEGKTREFPV